MNIETLNIQKHTEAMDIEMERWFSTLPPEAVTKLMKSMEASKLNQAIDQLPDETKAAILQRLKGQSIVYGNSYSMNNCFMINNETPVAEVMRRGADLVAERAAEIVMSKLESYFNQKAQNMSAPRTEERRLTAERALESFPV